MMAFVYRASVQPLTEAEIAMLNEVERAESEEDEK